MDAEKNPFLTYEEVETGYSQNKAIQFCYDTSTTAL